MKDCDGLEISNTPNFTKLSREWFLESLANRYSYRFTWMGRPIIQYPQDILIMQEILFRCRPELVIETGIAHGGSLILYASLLQLMEIPGEVLGIDVDIRSHNREAILKSPFSKRIRMIEGSSTDQTVLAQVEAVAKGKKSVMVCLDSNHSHEHVLNELKMYSKWVTKGNYLVVFDTCVEDMGPDLLKGKPWGPGNSPRSAVNVFLQSTKRFEIDLDLDKKAAVTVCGSGFLKCISD